MNPVLNSQFQNITVYLAGYNSLVNVYELLEKQFNNQAEW